MLRKLVLVCAAVAALGATALTPSVASARGFHGGGFHGGGFHGGGFRGGGFRGGGFHRGFGGPRFFIGGPAYYGGYGYYGGCYVRRLIPTPWGLRWRLVNRCY